MRRSRTVPRNAGSPARRSQHTGQGGLSLLELLLGIALTAIILAPLSAAFLTMVGGSGAAHEELDRSGDAARIGEAWTQDVQSVDVGGVGTAPCEGESDGSSEVVLVSFSSNTSSSAQGPSRTATWVAVGTGSELELVRRVCEQETLVFEDVLARRIGIDGQPITEVVHGPNPAEPNQFCPDKNFGTVANPSWISDSCTIVVDGDLVYELEVARRVVETADSLPTPVPPPPPTILVGATQARNTYLIVGWTPPSMVSGQPPIESYRVNVYLDAGGNGAPVASVVVSGTNAQVDGLTNHTDYYVRVQARNSAGWGEYTPVHGPLTPQPTAPDAPTITGTPIEGDTSLTVSWTPNANNGGSDVTSWVVTAQPGSGGTVAVTIPHVGAQTAVQTGTIPGLQNGAAYTVTVAGINASGPIPGLSSPPSGTLIPYGVPGPATNLQSSPNADGTINLSWVAPAFNGGRPITGYRVIVDNGPAAGPWPSASTWYSPSTTSVVLNGLTLGSQYTFRVLTNNLRGYSTSGSSEPPILSATLPGIPPTVSVTQSGAGTLVVSWGAAPPNGSPISEYEIRSSPAIAGTPRSVAGTTLSTTFTGLNSGTTYTFWVRGKNVAGWGPERSSSGIAGGVPSWGGAAPSLSRSGSSYPFAVNVSWNRPSNSGGSCIKSYRIEYSATSGGSVTGSQTLSTSPGAFPGCAGEPSTALAWTNLTAGVHSRYFRVVAINQFNLESASTWSTIHMSQACTVIAVEDSWVNEDGGGLFSSSKRGDNYGGNQNLRVDKSGDQLYVKFNPSSSGSACSQFGAALPAAAVVLSGEVELYNSNSTTFNRDHEMSRVSSGWSEYGITYNNRPGIHSGSATVSAADGGWRRWWVYASHIDAERSSGTRFGWNVRDTGGNILSDWAEYRSRESNEKPRLHIIFY